MEEETNREMEKGEGNSEKSEGEDKGAGMVFREGKMILFGKKMELLEETGGEKSVVGRIIII